MNILRYTLLRLRRDVKNALITLISFLAVITVILFIQQSAFSRQQTLNDMASAMEVKGELADSFGTQTERLQMDKFFPRLFMSDAKISPLVKDVCVLGNYKGMLSEKKITITGITHEMADQTLFYDGEVLYEEGYDESIWMTDEMVCVITDQMRPWCYEGEDGHLYLDVTGIFYSFYYAEDAEIPFTLRVVGRAVGPDKVYCPYLMLERACTGARSISFFADSLSFTVKDNHRLDDLRTALLNYFKDSDIKNAGSQRNVVILKDAEYLKLTGEARKNIEIMALLRPVLYLCALGAGTLLVVMQMRGRKKEMAVIRSLGAGRLRVMVQSILEYALLCLPVTLFALLVWRELSPMTVFGVWLAFMAGALCTIIRFSMIPLVKQIRELEE